jgi:hypothetical protein
MTDHRDDATSLGVDVVDDAAPRVRMILRVEAGGPGSDASVLGHRDELGPDQPGAASRGGAKSFAQRPARDPLIGVVVGHRGQDHPIHHLHIPQTE